MAETRQFVAVFPDLRACILASGIDTASVSPRVWAATATTIVLETQGPRDNRRAVIEGSRVTWTVDGRAAPADTSVDRWQKAVMDLLEAKFDAARGSALRTRIDSVRMRRNEVASQIPKIEAEEMRLIRRIDSLSRQARAARSQEQALRQRVRDLRSQAQSAASQAARATDEASRTRLQAAASNLERQAASAESQLSGFERRQVSLDLEKRLVYAETDLRNLDATSAVSGLRMENAALQDELRDLEADLQQLMGNAPASVLEDRVSAALARVRALLR